MLAAHARPTPPDKPLCAAYASAQPDVTGVALNVIKRLEACYTRRPMRGSAGPPWVVPKGIMPQAATAAAL
jgi:hypothetical protein